MLKRTPLRKGNKILKDSGINKNTRVRKVGKTGKKRKEANNQLKEIFNSLEINYCEAKLEGCLGNLFLAFAHSKKSRKFIKEEDWTQAIMACQHCHAIIEGWKAELMEDFVNNIINNRKIK